MTRISKRDRRATLPQTAADLNAGPSTCVTVRIIQRNIIDMGFQSRTPTRKRHAWFLPDDRHTASLVGLRGGWSHARMNLCYGSPNYHLQLKRDILTVKYALTFRILCAAFSARGSVILKLPAADN
ncbi:hypothetical protein TNCV_3899001 [Trichonephila clavipes]|nr:hypothetical protein TNCV_3899001 [Trichonephila clavipes]